MSKKSKTARRAGQSRALPFVPLTQKTRSATVGAMNEGRAKFADLLQRHPLPTEEANARLYLERTRFEARQKVAAAQPAIARYVREPERLQTDEQKREASDVLMTFLAYRRRLEILDEVEAGAGTATEKVSHLQRELIRSVIPMVAGFVFGPVKEQYGRDDAFALLAGLLLGNLRRMPSVEQAARDAAPGVDNPILYAALLAVAEGKPDAANIGDFHEVFAEARKALNAQRREMGAAVADSDMTEDRSVDVDADPARLLLAAFEQQEAANLHDERARFLELLTDPQRTALLLNAAGVPRREIAERMNVGEETVKTHIAAGRKHVANWMENGKLPRGKKL